MKAIVKKGYVVHFKGKMYREGMEIPSSIVQEILKYQHWKVEVTDGNKKETEKGKTEGTATTSGDGKKEEKIEDITSNRMIKDDNVRKRGK